MCHKKKAEIWKLYKKIFRSKATWKLNNPSRKKKEIDVDDVDSLRKDYKEFIKNNKWILKTQWKVKIDKIASSSGDVRMKSIDLI